MKLIVKQAVMLCGGLGTRLRPFTDSAPKPMIQVNGRPFLDYLFEQLIDNGIHQVLLLTGYRADQISEHYGSNYKTLSISYSQGDVNWNTAERLEHASNLIDEYFLLMYSDNFSFFSLDKALKGFTKEQSLRLHLSKKNNGNITVDDSNKVVKYDPSREHPADYVELGYMLVNKKMVFKYLTKISQSFTGTIIKCVESGTVSADISLHPYHSISDPHRLNITAGYFKPKKIILVDRDGVINQKAPKAEYITHPKDFHFIDDTVTAMQDLSKKGFSFIVISNQAGVGRGVFSLRELNEVNFHMQTLLNEMGVTVLGIYVCTHAWDENCTCRKPRPGMLIEASIKHDFRLDECLFIGDDPRDVIAAHNANAKSILINCSEQERIDSGVKPTYFAPKLSELLEHIKSFYQNS
jgi:D-glycero-D-manno-heptose 1,7-bisphosphate phosphatase